MKGFRSGVGCLILVCAMGARGAETGSISGLIRDAESKPVAGARVTVTCGGDRSSDRLEATTGQDGAYRLAGIVLRECQVAVERAGFVSPSGKTVRLSPAAAAATADFTLTPNAPGRPAPASGPRFEAAGVRGLIDPGGYSAPASAAAASGLVEGIADLKRADPNSAALAETVPCSLEPALRKAVDSAPGNVDALQRLGRFYLIHGQPARAIPLFERARQTDAGNYEASRDLADGWIQDGKFDSARTLLNTMAGRGSEPEIHALLARAQEGLGLFAQAAEEYRKASLRDSSEENLFGVGYELILSGSAADGGKAFEAGLGKYPRSARLLTGVATAEFLQGRDSQAVLSLLRATELDSSDPRPFSFLVKAYTASGAYGERVRASLKRFVERAPESAEAHYLYALTFLRGSAAGPGVDAGMAEPQLRRATELDPNLGDARFRLGALCADRGDAACALGNFEAAARLLPDRPEIHYRLSIAYRHAGKEELAARELKVFQQTSSRQKDGDDSGIEKFISVIHGKVVAGQCSGER